MKQFRDREDAGDQLAAVLRKRGFIAPVVLGIPRGGVPVAASVARALGGSLGVVVARKLGAPYQPELAIGAVTADGVTWINESVARETGAGPEYIRRETAAQVVEARRREEAFDGHRRPAVSGRAVILVDDGVATGATALAAARSLRAAGARPLVIAVPVAPPATIALLEQEADEVVCLRVEEDFWAIGEFYRDFSPVEDSRVRELLDSFSAGTGTREARVTRDGVQLAVRLRLPGHLPAPVTVFVHGLGSSKESPRNVVIAERLVDMGAGALLFDLSGHGESSPDPRESVDAYVDDLAAIDAWVRAQSGVEAARVAIAGSSLGAVVALRAVLDGRVKPAALVLRAPPAEPGEFRGLTTPTLLLVGSRDSLLEQATAAARVSPAIELRVVEGASHLFEEPGTLEEAANITTSWLCHQLTGATIR
jgi:predicted phosphoribosyltransferase/predicted alpha/beta-hydrolase family hydrolase